MKWLLRIVVLIFVAFSILFFAANGALFLLEASWLLVTGWWSFLQSTLPAVRPDIPAIVTATLALGLLIGGLHISGRRVLAACDFSDITAQPRIWRFRWTIAIGSSVLLLFTAGISMVGVVHQVAWLVFSNQPLLNQPSVVGRTVSRVRLQNLGKSLAGWSESHGGELPPAGELNSRGQPMHSVLTMLLPSFGGDLKILASRIDFSKPWNHPDNKAVFGTSVEEYRLTGANAAPSASQAGSGYAISNYAGNQRVFQLGRSLPLKSITDGLSNTLFFGEAIESPRAWGDPLNLRDPALGFHRGPASFSSPWETDVQFLRGDGSVQSISRDTSPEILRALSTPAGGDSANGF